jgi:multiple sugar transport system permease protein
MHLWGSGGAMLIFLAALQNVPERLYEAARLDGAGRWRRFRHVTLPQISPVILFNFVVGLIGAVRVFRPAYVLRHWSQDDGLLFYMVYLYENAFEDPARLGFASALTWILFVVLFVLTLLTVLISRRWVHYED